jgi:hypothetical protein
MSVYKAIAGVMADLAKIGIGKDKTNAQQGFKYRGVDDVMNELAALLPKHGLVILPRVTKRETVERQSAKGNALFYVWLDVEYDFVATEDGSKHVVGPVVGEAMDSGDKASNKAMSIAYKYACFQAFCIPTEAVDPDKDVHDVLTPAQVLGKQFVEALTAKIDDRVYEVWEKARTDPKTYTAAWKLLTPEERDAINKALERSKASRAAA